MRDGLSRCFTTVGLAGGPQGPPAGRRRCGWACRGTVFSEFDWTEAIDEIR